MAACDKAPVVAVNYLYFDRVTEDGSTRMIAASARGRSPRPSRGGVPGDLKEVSPDCWPASARRSGRRRADG